MNKNRSRKSKWIVLMVVLLLLALAFLFRNKVFQAFMPVVSEVKVTSIVIEQDSLRLGVSMMVTNPKFWPFTILAAEIEVFDDTVLVMTYKNPEVRHFDRGESLQEEFALVLPVEILKKQIHEHQGEDTVRLRVVGSFVFTSIGGTMSRDVDMQFPVVVPIPPTIRIISTEYLGKNDGRYNLMVHLALRNENRRSLEMKEISYNVAGEDLVGANGYLAAVNIAAQDSTMIAVPVSLVLKDKTGIIVRIILDEDVVNYNFTMRGTLVALSGLVTEDVPVTVSTNGKVELYDRKRKDAPKLTWRKRWKNRGK